MRWLSPPERVPEERSQRQVVEADVDQETQPLADLLQDAAGDLVLLRVQGFGTLSNHSPARLIDNSEISPMCLPSILTHKRLRLQPMRRGRSAQGMSFMNTFQLLARPFASVSR